MTLDRRTPTQWPIGVIVGVCIAILDVMTKALLGELALDVGPLRPLGPLAALVNAEEGGARGAVALLGLLAAAVLVLFALARVRRRLSAAGLGLLLGGLLGKMLDLWDDGAATDIFQLGPDGGAPPMNLADLSLAAGALLLAVALLRRRRGKSFR